MARVEYGALVTELTGSIGGMTFQRSKSGFICRVKPSAPRCYNDNQNYYQTILVRIIQKWRTLSLLQQQEWDVIAAANIHTNIYGRQYYLSGYNFFISCNLNSVLISEGWILSPPGQDPAESVPVALLDMDEHSAILNLSTQYDGTKSRLVLFTTPPIYSTRSKNIDKYLLTSIITKEKYKDFDFTSDWNNTHSLDYLSIYSLNGFRISAKIISINKTSGLNSVATFIIGDLL